MKKALFSLAIFAFAGLSAQTGKVGINTDNPTRKLDVKGDVRVQTLTDVNTSTETADYNQVLVANDGTTTANNKGNVDYIPLSEFSRRKTISGRFPNNHSANYIAGTLSIGNLDLRARMNADAVNIEAKFADGESLGCQVRGDRYGGSDFAWEGFINGSYQEIFEYNYELDRGGNATIQCSKAPSGPAFTIDFMTHRHGGAGYVYYTISVTQLN